MLPRFAACRNYLDSLGLIDWEDNRYVIGVKDKDGNVIVEGRAMKWKFDSLLMQLLTAEDNGSEAENHEILLSMGEETSFSITSMGEILEAIDFIPSDQQTRPELVNEDEYEPLDYSLLDRIVASLSSRWHWLRSHTGTMRPNRTKAP